MMSTTARLQFGDNGFRRYAREYQVLDFKCHVVRPHNDARPDGSARCECMELTLVVPGRDDLNLYEWYVGGSDLSGRILVELPTPAQNQAGEWKEILFENGVCYALSENYHIDEQIRRTLTLSIVVDEITVDGIIFKTQ